MLAVTFAPFAWSGPTLYALTAICLGVVVYALRSEARTHPYGEKVTRMVAAGASALTIAYVYLVVHESVLFSCEYAWWTLECWLWA